MNNLLSLSLGASLLFHLMISPFAGNLLKSNDDTEKTTHIITEILNDMSRGDDHKSDTIDHSQSIGMSALKVEPIHIEIPLQHKNTIKPVTQNAAQLARTTPVSKHRVTRRQQSPLSRRPEQLQRKYTNTIAHSIRKHLPYIAPQNAPKEGARVVVKVVINTVNGSLKKVSIAQSSHSWSLDQAAIMAIKKAAPFPPLDIPWEELTFLIPLRYQK